MPAMIVTEDCSGQEELRAALRKAHFEYLDRHKESILFSGGVLDDHGKVIGGVIIVDLDGAEVKAFISDDPFTVGGLQQKTTVQSVHPAFIKGQWVR